MIPDVPSKPVHLTAADIRDLHGAAPDYSETEELKAGLAHLRRTRKPFCLHRAELELIFRWKLGQQYGRQKSIREGTRDSTYRTITRAAFEIDEEGSDREAEMRLRILMALPGVGMGVASAILALSDPTRYCVIDFRGWRAVFSEERREFCISHYLEYRVAIANLAAVLGWPVQEADLAVWAYDNANLAS
jgi:hypothetical protein